jgi:hypothetical protein
MVGGGGGGGILKNRDHKNWKFLRIQMDPDIEK